MQVTGNSRLSIQLSSNGYLYRIYDGDKLISKSDWIQVENEISQPEFEYDYVQVTISILTPKVSIFPSQFFLKEYARELLTEVVKLTDKDIVTYSKDDILEIVTIFSTEVNNSNLDNLKNRFEKVELKSELALLLNEIHLIEDYNKILVSYLDGYLYLVIANDGKTLRLANVFKAADFTTALYFLFYALKKFQINPEISTLYVRTPLEEGQNILLYRYFKSVEEI